jgi:segregation and condensation protein A
MSYTVKLQQFEGPLGALLELIESQKLDITEVALATVTEGYLKLLDENPDLPTEEMADFLVIASKLLLIKSKHLLPFLTMDGIEETVDDLESQLRIYKEYLDASKVIEKMIAERRFTYVHDKLPKFEQTFSPPKKLTVDDMRELFIRVIARLEPVVKPSRQALERTMSIHEKISQIRDLLTKASKVSFRKLLESAQSKTEVIVSFLALLELVKQRNISVTQDKLFEDITIAHTAAPAA